MNERDRRLPWLIGGAVVLIALCCVLIIVGATAAPRVFNRGDKAILSEILSPPQTVLTTPRSVTPRPAAIATATPAPPSLAGSADGVDLETQIYTRIYQSVNPSVVAVRVLDEEVVQDSPHSDIQPFFFNTGEGSGFVIDEMGHIVTNRHVVLGAERVVVQFYDGILAPAEVVGVDRDTDLAVIKVDPEGLELTPVTFGNLDNLRVGDRIIVIGNPFGNTNTLTTGIVSALGRQISLNDSQYRLPEVIQTDAAINPGNSGGPMLNARGEVVGVAFMLQSETRSNSGIGFGIPVYFVERVARAIVEDGDFRHAYLGIRGNGLSPFEIRALDLQNVSYGILVAEVINNTPAAKAGLKGGGDVQDVEGVPFRIGGDIIIAVNDRPIKVFEDLLAYLGRYSGPGDTITLTVIRDGSVFEFDVTLEARPD